jgi:hypothetical protein
VLEDIVLVLFNVMAELGAVHADGDPEGLVLSIDMIHVLSL